MNGLTRERRTELVRNAAVMCEESRWGRMLPNALTLLSLCCGATAIRFALASDWKAAVAAIVCAAVFDALDGRLARLIHVDGQFGAQLDSLADLVSFGIAPGVLVYMWTLYHAHGAGWAFALIFCACSAIRLARFNVESTGEAAPAAYFSGVPTPAAACLILLPMLLGFEFKGDMFSHPWLSAAMIAAVSWLMVSRVPTLSLKRFKVPARFKAPAGVAIVLLLASALLWPWITLTIGVLAYLGTIPFGIAAAVARRRRAAMRATHE
ncbi:MAG: CDP-diacylglycerol--serine O-phosphatidyltransferase [Rhizomicrobium sp.]|jgi:CDP-diacylglycerol--serine O-phosphatidyltransferase